jgi:hypothetical protein
VINKEIIVFDGGAVDNPLITPLDSVVWGGIPVSEGKYVHISDEVYPHCGLTFQQIDNVLPFIRLPQAQSLNILSHTGHQPIIKALNACEKLQITSLVRSDRSVFLVTMEPKFCIPVQVFKCLGIAVRCLRLLHTY